MANFYHDEVIRPGRAILLDIIESGVAKGVFRPVDTQVIAHIVMAPMLHLALWSYNFV